MKRFLILLFIPLASTAVCAQTPVPELKGDADVNFFKLPPDLHFGETSGVAVNSKGHVFVFSRGNTNRSSCTNTTRAPRSWYAAAISSATGSGLRSR